MLRTQRFKSQFVRKELVDGGNGFVCYYPGERALSERSQGYRVINVANLMNETMAGEYLRALQRDIEKMRTGQSQFTSRLFTRDDCPLTIDPDFAVVSQFIMPDMTDKTKATGSIPEKMANYFVDDYLVQEIADKPDALKIADDAFKNKLRAEIIKFETIVVTKTDLDRAIDSFIKEERQRGFDATREPRSIMRERFAGSMRTKLYKEKYGRALFDMAASTESMAKGIPNYLAVRRYPPLSELVTD
jgi:hypothetical protein